MSSGPVLQVVQGKPDADELAAVVAVLAIRAEQPTTDDPGRPASWAAHWRRLRQPPRPGPDGWRDSARPR